ncbi:uncharacterized protein KY384_006240 [Bacidia gigantensis]|uniref:uncharacterized protein n=1 Tax=Bacidia gigantensis TaxID=2732470 RepID=UPI001D058463|nr:uncharacterized protein KY384_006240 [Bacidia gigantensis]KAG8529603.1 hypothetical protein KY384_006240 [Bacidia gigantensis]
MSQIETFIKAEQAQQTIFCCAITAIKLSILFFYRRLFPYRTFTLVALAVGIVNILWWLGALFVAFLHCRPLAFYWDKSLPSGVCSDDKTVGFALTGTELVTDIIVLILPIPWLWGLKRTIPRRVAVVGLFLLGSFVCVAGLVRIPLLAQIDVGDATWTAINAGIWSGEFFRGDLAEGVD